MSEEKQIRKLLDDIQMPDSIAGAEFQLGVNQYGEPAAYIRVIIKDEAWSDDRPYEFAQQILRNIYDAFQEAGLEHWPYMEFITEADLREVQAARKFK